MTPAHEQILNVLLGYLSAMNAEGVLLRAMREADILPERFSLEDLPDILPSIERRARLYVDPARLGRLKAEIAAVGGDRPSRRSRVMAISVEADISEARLSAKAVCDAAGAKSFTSHKVATIVSELARNIVHYTPGGTIEIGVHRDSPVRFVITAVDEGSGIQNLQEILAGRYRSKTGMGRGLIGIKRLSDRFQIDSGPKGTRVEIEVHL
ncbi:serine/threonine protein kinase [Sorangium cellulosum]|uniref:Serine/threonine protein kinase n=1 Tax=Sorangium cellulosum TaxID=56 RepID=A0A4P2Q2A3_SORCE|nr:ATP-binding protein [Sorangium cellulosum]AUX22973.1 serine/threonine protein kinase [Sorangium cellulosum]